MKNKKICFLLAIVFVLSILVYMYKKPVIMFLGREYKMYFVHTTKLDLKSSPLREGEEEKLRDFKNLKSLNFRTSTVNNLNFLNEMHYVIGIIACSICALLNIITLIIKKNKRQKDITTSVLSTVFYLIAIICLTIQMR